VVLPPIGDTADAASTLQSPDRDQARLDVLAVSIAIIAERSHHGAPRSSRRCTEV